MPLTLGQTVVNISTGQIVLALLSIGVIVAVLVWWFTRTRYFRIAWAALGAMSLGAFVPKLAASFDLVDVGKGQLFIDSPGSIAWPAALIAAVALVCDLVSRKPTKPSNQADAPVAKTTILGLGNATAAGTGNSATSGSNSPVIHGNATIQHGDPELVDKLLRGMSDKDQEIGSLRQQLADATARVRAEADAGDESARAALEEARATGDPEKIQAELIALRDQQEQAVRERAADYLALNREIAAVTYVRGDITACEDALRKILAFAPGDPDAINQLGLVYRLRGDLPAAESQYQKLINFNPHTSETRAIALGNLGLIARVRGNLDEAERLHRESLDINRQLGSLEGQANQLGNLGLIARIRGDLGEAERLHRESLDIERQLGRLEGQANQLGNLGLIAQKRGDLDEAERLHRESLGIERQLGRLEGQASDLGNLGIIAQTRGDLDEAEELHRESLNINRQLGCLEGQASDLGNLGNVALAHGNFAEAEKLHRESLDIEHQLGRLEGQASELGNLGSIAEQRGNLDEARQLWTQSRDLFIQVGAKPLAEQVQSWLDALPATDSGE